MKLRLPQLRPELGSQAIRQHTIGKAATSANRGGFTLVELLVVITIIGILMSMLLPAVQQIRSAARRMQCGSRMKNVALALHNYHTALGKFPPGWISKGQGNGTRDPEWGWPAMLLPYVEQQALYDQLRVDERRLFDVIAEGDNSQGQQLLQTTIPIYRCPQDDTPDILPRDPEDPLGRKFDSNADMTFQPATSNYIGNNGFYDRGYDYRNNGVFYGNSRVRIEDIKDGTSNTFLVGERDYRCSAGTWIGSRNPPHTGMWGSYQVRARVSMQLNDPTNEDHDTCTEGFSSAHTTGANFAFADGSIHFINENIEFANGGLTTSQIRNGSAYQPDLLGLYQRLGVVNDNLTVSLEDL